MQKISPFLWFNDQAEEAVNLYVSIFKNSKIKNITRYNDEGAKVSGMSSGTAMTIAFEIEGENFTALNGGPIFKFTEAVSFVVNCEDQAEINELWNKLTADGGQESQCGWLKDKFGLSWQIVPKAMGEIMGGPNKEGAARAMHEMLQMKKIDIEVLRKAYEG